MRRALLLALPVVLALASAFALWPRDLPPASAPVAAASVFTPAQIARAHSYRAGVDRLLIASELAPLAALALLAAGRRRLRRLRRPAAAALVTALAASAAALPFAFELHRRAAAAGLDLRGDAAWIRDALVGLAVQSVAVAVGYAVVAAATRRLGAIAGGAAFAAVVAAVVALLPLADMGTHPVRDPAVLAAASELERRMGVHPSLVVADNAHATTEQNAQTDGIGPTARIAIDQTFLRSATPAEVRALLAHELGHVQRHHILKGLALFALVAIPVVAAILWLVCRRLGMPLADPATAPVLLLCLVLVAVVASPAALAYSRRVEAEADWAGLRATRDGAGMEQLQRRLALADLSDPQPPRWAVWLLFDHPPVMDRIAVARAYPSASASASP